MDYKNKYIKYKTKYKMAKLNNNLKGGSFIVKNDDLIEKLDAKYSKKNIQKKYSKKININIYDSKYQHIFLYCDMTFDDINPIIKSLENPNKNGIIIHIHSGGGDSSAGLTLYNICKKIKVPIYYYTEGQTGSASTYLSFGFSKNRIIGPYSIGFIHQMNDEEKGQTDELEFKKNILKNNEKFYVKFYSKFSHLTKNEIRKILNYDFFLNANETLNLGFIDEINNKTRHVSTKKIKNLFLISPSKWTEYLDSKEIIVNIYDCIFNNIKPIINISDFNQGLESIRELTFILPLLNLCSTSPIDIECIINAPIVETSVLIAICCSYRKMTSNSMMIINFTNIKGEDWQPKMQSIIKAYKTNHNIIKNIFNKYTKLPTKILDDIMINRFIFNANECLKYKLIDEIIL